MANSTTWLCAFAWLPMPLAGPVMFTATMYFNRLGVLEAAGRQKMGNFGPKKELGTHFFHFFSIPWLRTTIFLRWKFWVSHFETNLNEGRSDCFFFFDSRSYSSNTTRSSKSAGSCSASFTLFHSANSALLFVKLVFWPMFLGDMVLTCLDFHKICGGHIEHLYNRNKIPWYPMSIPLISPNLAGCRAAGLEFWPSAVWKTRTPRHNGTSEIIRVQNRMNTGLESCLI